MNTHNNTTQYATHFYNLDANRSVTYMNIVHCDLHATPQEAYAWGQHMLGLHDGFVIETVSHTDQT